MTTLLVTLVLEPRCSEEVLARLRAEVAPWLRRRPGFVTSRWLLGASRDRCTILVEAEESAESALVSLTEALAPGEHGQGRSWWCERVDLVTDLHLAERPGVGG